MTIEQQFRDLFRDGQYFPSIRDEDRNAVHEAVAVLVERAGDDVLGAVRTLLGTMSIELNETLAVSKRGMDPVQAHVEREFVCGQMEALRGTIEVIESRESLLDILNNLYETQE